MSFRRVLRRSPLGPLFFVAIAAGVVVTAVTTNVLIAVRLRKAGAAGRKVLAPKPALVGVGGGTATGAAGGAGGTAAVGQGTPAAPAAAEAAPQEVLSGYLTERTVKPELASDSKETAIREMAEMLAATGNVRDVDELVRVALAREAQGTTGLGESIAIPHAKTDAVTRPTVGFARSAGGIE